MEYPTQSTNSISSDYCGACYFCDACYSCYPRIEKITGVNVREEETITIDGKTYKVTDELKSALKNLKELN
jgi:hypothetical protein